MSWIFNVLSAILLVRLSAAQTVGLENPACDDKQVIVQLFEWRWDDIALECETFLSQNGFCGVQISPPNENAIITTDYPRPWWERYQPVSYLLDTRSGTEAELIDMVHRCNAAGVRIFVDAVVNHMAANDLSGDGTSGSTFSGPDFDFPAVPYSESDFTPRNLCQSDSGNVDDYGDVDNVRNCQLSGLLDLYGAGDYVRQTVADYFNRLIEIGVAGFKIDASKNIWPEDLEAIIEFTNDLNVDQGFPAGTRPFFYHEVIDISDGEVTVDQYYGLGRVTEFRYSEMIALGIQDFRLLGDVYDSSVGMADPDKAFVFVDNQDNQRGHGGGGPVITFEDPRDYILATAFTLAQPYGYTRIMSSYYFGEDTDVGPPQDQDHTYSHVIINSENQCEGGWVCEHRWNSISKMVRFRNAVFGTDFHNYYNDGDILAFSRGDVGFFTMVKEGTLSNTFQTGLPAGTYEDLISCEEVTVADDGSALVVIPDENEPVFAICLGCSCQDVIAVPEIQLGPGSSTEIVSTSDVVTEPAMTTHAVTEIDLTTSLVTEIEETTKNVLTTLLATDEPAGTIENVLTTLLATDEPAGTTENVLTTLLETDEPAVTTENVLTTLLATDTPAVTTENVLTTLLETDEPAVTTEIDQTTTEFYTTTYVTMPEIKQRTVIFVYMPTVDGQDLFIRGGYDIAQNNCTGDVSSDPCSIEISTNSLGETVHYDKYNSWRVGDNYLDMYGAEPGQGTYEMQEASGTPLAWTSSDPGNSGYQDLNHYGDDYWMVDFDMDCSHTVDGWFEFKAYLSNDVQGWEEDVSQDEYCLGSAGDSAPYTSVNHLGKCGVINVVSFNLGECDLEYFEDETAPPSVTVPAITRGTKRTVVFVSKETEEGQDLFIRGGDVSLYNCSGVVSSDPCSIEISTNSLGETAHYDKYNAWREGDNYLDIYGAESGQGTYETQEASGTPLAWTSADPTNTGYQELNHYGDDYWMVDFDMDCSQTESGWFELKVYLSNDAEGWESDIFQEANCYGTAGGIAPYQTTYHLAKCGFINVFSFDSGKCTVDSFEDD